MQARTLLQIAAALLVFPAAVARAEPFDAALYTRILHDYTREVSDTAGVRVDYRGLGESADWRRLIANLSRTGPEALESRDEQLAFWINAYNILAIQVVLSRYPIASIKDVGSFLRPVWKHDAGVVGGKTVSLAWIEHDVLRPLGEPRIHAAIVCASVSCPSLRREPFHPVELDAQLSQAMARFLGHTDKGLRIDRAGQSLVLSKIFSWFEADFAARGGVIAIVRRHLTGTERDWLDQNPDPHIRYFDYNWGLNDLADVPERDAADLGANRKLGRVRSPVRVRNVDRSPNNSPCNT
jgi:hypothetical protein